MCSLLHISCVCFMLFITKVVVVVLVITMKYQKNITDNWNMHTTISQVHQNIRHESSSLKSPHWLMPSQRKLRLMQRPLSHTKSYGMQPTVKHLSLSIKLT